MENGDICQKRAISADAVLLPAEPCDVCDVIVSER
jgi:hypothetical protein